MFIFCLAVLKAKLWLMPILAGVWMALSLFLPYAIATSYGHSDLDFDYISHSITAIQPPGRRLFGTMVNMGVVMMALNCVLRCYFLKNCLQLLKAKSQHIHYQVNKARLLLGWTSALGISMVANFHTHDQPILHYTGSGMAFICGTINCWVQASMTHRVRCKVLMNKVLVTLQFIISFIMLSQLIIYITATVMFKMKVQTVTNLDSIRDIYLISASSEWLLVFIILTFTLTYIPDFKHVKIENPKMHLASEFEKQYTENAPVPLSDEKPDVQVQ